ncbi:MAG: ArsR/SmtB family transcription factor [Planktomarina sp.]
MDWNQTAQGFSAMGSEARLQVLKTLVRSGRQGLTISEIQEKTGMAASTLAHHLRFLAAGEVIRQEKIGRSVVNRAHFEHLEHLAHFILCECCADTSEKNHEG